MSTKDNIDILNSIYKNSRMAADCIDRVAGKCRDDELRDYIGKQRVHYDNSCKKVKQQIIDMGGKVDYPAKTDRVMAGMGITAKTMMDDSRSNIAKLMYDGTNMGIKDIAKTVNHASQADEETVSEAKQLLSAEERYADGLKRFL